MPVNFVRWYVTQLPLKLLRLFLNANLFLEDQLAIRLHARLLFVPIFQDRTIVGRLLSFVFRAIRIFGGIWVLIIADLVVAPSLLVWALLPFLPIIYRPIIFVWPVLFVLYVIVSRSIPDKKITARLKKAEIAQTLSSQARASLGILYKNPAKFFQKFCASSRGSFFLKKLNINPSQFYMMVTQVPLPKLNATTTILQDAFSIAKQSEANYINIEHIFTALTLPQSQFASLLKNSGIDTQLAQTNCHWLGIAEKSDAKVYLWDDDYYIQRLGGVNRGWLGVPTPVLDQFSTDLTLEASKGKLPIVVGREQAINEIVQVLARSERENVLLTGSSGCGKTSIVYKIAQRIIEGGVPKSLFSRRLVRLDPGSLVAGIQSQGGLEERMVAIVNEIKRSGNIILFLDDVHTLLAISSAAGNLDLFSFFKPYLASTDFQIIAATSTENYERYLEPNQDFTRLFQRREVPVATVEESIHILEIESLPLERKYRVVITLPAILACVNLSDRYIHDKVLPGKAYDLLDEAVTTLAGTGQSQTVTPTQIEHIVERTTHVQVHDATKREKDILLRLESMLHNRLVGQNEAVKAVADAMRRAKVGVRNENRPIASFLFVGPTGVGKTELAKALSQTYFGSEEAMVRFDMSEFQQQESIDTLIGGPSSAGHALPGRLTEAIRQKPSTLFLFDELEKANPAVLDLFLQILDEGTVTDSLGHAVTFKDTIIIATSNAATKEIEAMIAEGQSMAVIQTSLLELLSKYFRLEFLNRFDGIILFKPLTGDDMIQITELELKKLAFSLSQKGYKIRFAPELIGSLAQRGYDPRLGARPLRRLIQDEVESAIAKMILSEQIQKDKPLVIGLKSIPQQSFAS